SHVDDHLDHAKDGYVLDPTRIPHNSRGVKGRGAARPRLVVPDFYRTASEGSLHVQPPKDGEIPQGPAAIQAAIIDAARGGHGVVASTISSPDSTNYQGPRLSPNVANVTRGPASASITGGQS